MSITGDAEWDARLNELLYNDDIEYVKQGLEIADSLGVDVLEKAVGEMIKSNVYHVKRDQYDIEKKDRLISFALLQLQESNDQPFSFWKHFKVVVLSRMDLDYIPDGIGYLKNLELLYLDNNNLTELPDSIGNLKNLELLSLYDSNLSELPDTIGNLKNLESLDLSYNNLIELPNSIGKLTKLERLSVEHNNLRELPDTIRKLKKLQTLYLSGNNISFEEEIHIRKLLPKRQIYW